MTMQAKLSTWDWLGYPGPKLIFGKPDEGLFIETVLTKPKSLVGRKVFVHITAEQVMLLLKEFRTEAIRQRSKSMSDG